MPLDLEDVSRHFSQLFNSSSSPTNDLAIQNMFVDSLDRDFSLSELDTVLLSCKFGKDAAVSPTAPFTRQPPLEEAHLTLSETRLVL